MQFAFTGEFMIEKLASMVNYDRCIINITASIMASYGIDIGKKTLPELDSVLAKGYKNIMFFICDGMGSYNISQLLDKSNTLNSCKIANIYSVFPPTTVAALSSIDSGREPCEHALLGWTLRLESINKVVKTFSRVDVDSGKVVRGRKISKELKCDNIFGQINRKKVNTHVLSPFAPKIADKCYTLEDYSNRIVELSRLNGKKLLYCYYNQPDYDMHESGAFSAQARERIQEISGMIDNLKSQLSDTLIIMTADHGQRDRVEREMNKAILDCCANQPTVEPTATAFHIKAGKEQEFVGLFNQHMEGYILLTGAEMIASGLLGKGNNSQLLKGRVGDYFAIAVGKYFYVNELSGFIGTHAGLSQEEMTCPLIVVKCE